MHQYIKEFKTMGKKMLSITLAVVLLATSFIGVSDYADAATTELWAEGVNKTSGWIDPTQSVSDCWANSTASVIWWWQNQLKAKGYNIPSTVPTDIVDIRQAVRDTNPGSTDNSGGLIQNGLKNYLAKYYPTIANQCKILPEYTTATQYYGGTFSAKEQSAWIKDKLSKGLAIGMSDSQLHDSMSSGHTYVIWGAKFDANGIVTRLYYTDSSLTAKTNKLQEFSVMVYTCYNGDKCGRHTTNPEHTALKFKQDDPDDYGISYAYMYYFTYGDVLTFDLRDANGKTLDHDFQPIENSNPDPVIQYTIKYDTNGGTGTYLKPRYIEKGLFFTTAAPKLTRTGYTFDGWNTNAAGTGTSYAVGTIITPTEDMTLYAKWVADETTPPEETVKPDEPVTPDTPPATTQYTLTYDGNGNTSGTVPESETKNSGETFTVPEVALTKTNYTFIGWNTQQDGNGTQYTAGATINLSSNMTLYAQWQENEKFTLTYNGNENTEGTVPSSETKYIGEAFTVSQTIPIKTNYTFMGWNTEKDGSGDTYQPGATITATKNMTLYAKWQENEKYTLKYNSNDDTGIKVPGSQTKYEGEFFTVSSSIPMKTYYTFMGWNTNADGTGDTYQPGATIKATQNMTLYAKWQENDRYTLSYNGNGHTGGKVPASEEKYSDEDFIVALETPTKTNYTFIGWNTAKDGSGDTYQPGVYISIAENTTLYAQWKENIKYTLTYDGNGHNSGVIPASVEKYIGEKFTISTVEPEKTNYIFVGWNTEVNGTGKTYVAGDTIPVNADIILYAKWIKKIEYTLTYDGNGHTEGIVPAPVTKISGGIFTVSSANISKTNHTFVSWNTRPDGTGQTYMAGSVIFANQDLTLYAQWREKDQFTLSYNGNGNTGGTVPNSVRTYENNTFTVSGDIPTKAHHDFIGWNTHIDGSGVSYLAGDTIIATSDLTLYAQWKEHGQYSITYYGNGNTSGSASYSEQKYERETLIINTAIPIRTNYKFVGWNTQQDGNGKWYSPGEVLTVTQDLTLYAQWQEKDKYILSYDGNGNNVSGVPVQIEEYVDNEFVVSLDIPTREEYNFVGWNTAANGTGQAYEAGAKITVTKNLTLYAQWTKKVKYSLSYDANEGDTSKVIAPEAKYIGETFTVSLEIPTRANHIFLGWNTAKDGSGKTYFAGDTIEVTSSITLYAQWKEVGKYVIMYFGNENTGGTVPVSEKRYENSTFIVSSEAPIRTNYKFIGWNTKADGTGITYNAGDIIVVTGDIMLYAQWKQSTKYYFIYDGNLNTGGVIPPYEEVFANGIFTVSTDAPTRLNYTFTGWNTERDGSGTTYKAGDNIIATDDITLYAQWRENPKYTLVYSGNGNTAGEVPEAVTKYVGEKFTISSIIPVKKNYEFTLWNTSANGKGKAYVAGETITVTENITLYAQWRLISTSGGSSSTVNSSVNRYSGKSRYDTSMAIADAIKTKQNKTTFNTIIVANGEDFADALSGSFLSYKKDNAPILILSEKNASKTAEIKNYINTYLAENGTVYILGGSGVISTDFENSIKTDKNTVTRLWGKNRYETNLSILKEALKADGGKAEELIICSGSGYADSLSASAAKKPILLTAGALSDDQVSYIESLSLKNVILIGGSGAVTTTVSGQIGAIGLTQERIWGQNRYETSIKVAERFFKTEPTEIVLAYALDFPDGLSGGPLSLENNAPLILVDSAHTALAKKYVDARNITTVSVIGGEGVLSSTLVKTITGFTEK